MPRIKKATDANGTTFYPITISKGVWDTTKNQRLSQTLSDLDRAVSSITSTSVIRDTTTGTKTIASAAVNTVYSYATIRGLTVTALAAPTNTAVPAEYVFEFTLGSTVGTMSFPISVVWVDGVPEWQANKHYRVVMLYNAGDGNYYAYCEGTLGALGTAARKNVPTSGNASSSQVVMGDDTRLTNSRTPTSHTHGNIQNTGALQSSDVTIANGDKLVITDSSDSGKVARASVVFDGSTKTKALTKNGTFESFVSTAASQGLSDTEKSNARANIGLGNVGNFKAVSTEDQNLDDTEMATARSNIGLGNVGNFKAVSTAANQGLTDTEKSNARANIGLGNVDNTADANKSVNYANSAGNADTVDGCHYNELPYVKKVTYEWNKSVNFGSNGYLLIGKFPMYDSNITIDIDSTTNTTYHGTLVIATQNINTSRGGSVLCNVYGDATNTVTGSFRVQYSSGSNNINVYFVPESWSKNLIHIRASALAADPVEEEICTYVESVPTTDLISVNNVLINSYPSSLPASDVYSWAKAANKPSYTLSEVGASMSSVAISSNTSSTCSITGSSNAGKTQTIIYTNNTSSDLTVTVPTTYTTPDGQAIELTCKAGGYCEVSYINIGGTIYARGL